MEETIKPENVIVIDDDKSVSKFSSMVLLNLFIGLIFTAAVTFSFSYLIYSVAVGHGQETAYSAIGLIMAISGFTLLGYSIFVNFFALRKGKMSWPIYLIYCFLMGAFLSTMTIFIEPWVLGMSIGITSLIFLVCYCIGYYSKVSLNPLGILGFGLLMGVCLVSIPFLILRFAFPQAFVWYEFVISIVVIIAIVLLVTFETYRMKREVMGSTVTKKDALMYSYIFYSDFISILVRIIYIIGLSDRRN